MGILRFLLAITVVFAHSPWNGGMVFVGPRIAVQLFYITSGFLISYVLTERKDYINHWSFYKSRLLRLYPIYLTVAIITLLIFWFLNPAFFALYGAIPTSAATMLKFTNLTLFGQDWVMFTAVNQGDFHFSSNFKLSDFELWRGLLAPQAWSLGVELCFYTIAPFILHKQSAIIILLIISILIRVFLFSIGLASTDPWTYRFFPAELSFFLTGALSHQLLLPRYARLPKYQLKTLSCIATFSFTLFASCYFLIPVLGAIKSPVLYASFVLLLPLFFTHQRFSSTDRNIGELSYPIYIGHFLIIFLVEHFSNLYSSDSYFLITLFNIFFSIAFAVLLNKFIGNPIETFRRQSRLKPVTSHTAD